MNDNITERAEKTALKLLRYRNTARGLVKKLIKKGFDSQTARTVTEKMKSLGYICDEEYAKAFVSDSININRWGRRKILCSLVQRGIDKSLADLALEEIPLEQDMENLRYFMVKTFGEEDEISAEEAGKFKRKMLSRGFYSRQIDQVLTEIHIEEEY